MMKKFTILVLFLSVFSSNISKVSAHVLKSDGSIGGVLHINPDDDPIVGQPTQFFVEIKDTKKEFSWQDCGCRITILKDGNQLYSAAFLESGATYTFDSKGIYQVQVSGDNPKFNLDYSVRVSRENVGANSTISLWQKIVEWILHIFQRG